MNKKLRNAWLVSLVSMLAWSSGSIGVGQDKSTEPPPKPEEVVIPEGLDSVARLQHVAITALTADWGYWGYRPSSYSSWTNHSNRLIPIYVFGDSLQPYINENSIYRRRNEAVP